MQRSCIETVQFEVRRQNQVRESLVVISQLVCTRSVSMLSCANSVATCHFCERGYDIVILNRQVNQQASCVLLDFSARYAEVLRIITLLAQLDQEAAKMGPLADDDASPPLQLCHQIVTESIL